MRPRPALLAVALAALVLAGCTSSGSQQVSNNQDSFRYTADWRSKAGTEQFTWKNTLGSADVNIPAHLDSSGAVNLRVADATGKALFEQVDTGEGIRTTRLPAGQPGDWTIELAFDAFKGHLEVRISAARPAGTPSPG